MSTRSFCIYAIPIFILFSGIDSIGLESKSKKSEKHTTKTYKSLREAAIKTTLKDLGVDPKTSNVRVYGVVMDMAFEKGSATLVSYISGDASLYFSGGGGMIGGGVNESVRSAALKFVQSSSLFLSQCAEAKDFPLPSPGTIRFYFLTHYGVYTIEAEEEKLKAARGSSLTPLFLLGNEVLTALRELEEKKSAATLK